MVKQYKHLSIAVVIALLLMLITVKVCALSSLSHLIIFYSSFLIVFLFLPQRKSFVFLVAIILMSGLIFLLIGLIDQWSIYEQLQRIKQHIYLTMNLTSLYFLIYLSKKLEEENIALKKQIVELSDYVNDSKLLTKQEFEERSKIVLKGMNRRQEEGYLIYFSLEKYHPYVRASVFDLLTEVALQTFREDYDLIGQENEFSFIVLLQNTHEEGLNIALDRYLKKISKRVDLEPLHYCIKTIDVKNNKVEYKWTVS